MKRLALLFIFMFLLSLSAVPGAAQAASGKGSVLKLDHNQRLIGNYNNGKNLSRMAGELDSRKRRKTRRAKSQKIPDEIKLDKMRPHRKIRSVDSVKRAWRHSPPAGAAYNK